MAELSEARRAAIAALHAGNRGKPRSAETRAKIAAAKRGKPRPPEVVEKVRAKLIGRTLSPEHVEHMAAALRGRPRSPQAVEAVRQGRAAAGGWAHFPETVERIRATKLAQATPYAERFWAKVDRTGGPDACWPWLATPNPSGYGVAYAGKSPTGQNRTRLAHRVAWELAKGSDPGTAFVLHRCDNPPCCNPAHLFLGDAEANARDMAAKGRWRNQSSSGHSYIKAG